MMQQKSIKKGLRIAALTFVVIAVVLAVVSHALARTLPYRIGPNDYSRYLWAERLFWSAMLAPLAAILLGIVSRQWKPITLAVFSLFLVLLCAPGGVHSGPNPQAWCMLNLHKIDVAKHRISSENLLSNQADVPTERLSKFIEGGFDSLRCVKHGNYTINVIGIEPRCSVHGSLSEMDAGKKRRIHQ